MTYVDPAEFEAKFHHFRRSVFRLETLQTYRGSGEDEAIAAFEAGEPVPPPDPVQDAWEDMIRANRAAGRVMQRVHVVVEPPSDYLRFELTWAYAPNVAAGEDIRIIPTTCSDWARRWHRDFWLFDESELFDADYTADGTWLGVSPVPDPTRVAAACRCRTAAMDGAVPWADYIAARPQLAARLPSAGGVARSG